MVTGYKTDRALESDASHQTLNAMEKIVHEIQNLSLSLRMSPIAPLFQKLKRIARDASQELHKTIEFVTEGEHVEVDKSVMDQISDPLNHLIRNAVDHGVETDTERAATGKKSNAVITLKAQQQDNRIVITLSDNGRGMNAEKLIAKAKEKGLIAMDTVLTNEQAYALIFSAGFSTKEKVTDMSGRGVGMDVVQKAVWDLKGQIDIQTTLGQGTQFIISLPLSMSILTGMVVRVDQQKYVVPISQLIETVELKKFTIESSTEKGRMFNLRGQVIPIHSLSNILHGSQTVAGNELGTGLVIAHKGRKFLFAIDEICGQQEIVLKKLGRELQDVPGIIAGAILST
ncbi:MAG: chemotaxis protein CheA, partial [Proteobacteria bacterium]